VKLESERADRQRVTWSTVASWRDQVHNKMKRAPAQGLEMAVETYRIFMEKMASADAWPPNPDGLPPQQRKLFCKGVLKGLSWFLTHGAT
jgi:hypothetical protein